MPPFVHAGRRFAATANTEFQVPRG